jgi:hypothetical protein
MVESPAIVLNAVVNVPYWMAQAYILQEPFGVVLCMLAYLLASFLVNPLRYQSVFDHNSLFAANPVALTHIFLVVQPLGWPE